MHAHRVGRNDPCPCGSGQKFKHCCYHNGSIPAPALYSDGASQPTRLKPSLPPRRTVRVKVDYTFGDALARAEVTYSFERGQLFLLTNGRVVDVDHLTAGMEFY